MRWLYVVLAGVLVAGPVYAGSNGWTTSGPSLPGVAVSVVALAIDPQTPATVYAGILGGTGGVYKSANGGESWAPASNGLAAPVSALAIDPLNPATVYAGAQPGGVFKSTNGGGSWTAMNIGLSAMTISALAIHPNVQTQHDGLRDERGDRRGQRPREHCGGGGGMLRAVDHAHRAVRPHGSGVHIPRE